MKFLIFLVLVAIAVGVFMVVGNTQKDTPEGPSLTEFMCSQADSGCR